MHRATPLNSSFRAYSAGGARSVVDKVDDKKLMQEMSGNMMRGENRGGMESPQNYGFTSVNMPADKDKDGNISMGSETFISFMGGNRSFPVAGPIDDRRHRLKSSDDKKMEDGDSAMHRTKDDCQQFHLHKEGNFMSCRNDRIQRIALVPPPQQEQQQQPQAGGGAQQQKKATGQTHVLDDNKKSTTFIEQSSKSIHQGNGSGHHEVKTDKVTGYFDSNERSYRADKGHSHIKNDGAHVWVQGGVCYKSVPFVVQPDPCS
jgi:phage gp45-like